MHIIVTPKHQLFLNCVKLQMDHENAPKMIASEDPGTTEIVLIRHGETTHNSAGILQGQFDSELNETGWRQANAVAERVAKESKYSQLYTSDLKRAFDTASLIGGKCGLQAIPESALRERHLGVLEGLKRNEAPSLHPKAFKTFVRRNGSEEIPGGGESYDQFYTRVVSALENIANIHKGERVIVVTHGGTLFAIWQYIKGRSFPGKAFNTSINVVHRYEDGRWDVCRWGDIEHLKDIDFTNSAIGADNDTA